MIASFSHDFIFVKTRKVGGTSLEIVLSSWCSGRDICTPITAEDEVIRGRFGGQARNFRRPDGAAFYNHIPAVAVRAALPGLWQRAFKFAVDRHPYEKVVSRAWWNIGRRGSAPEGEIEGEIARTIETRSYLNFPLYCADGRVIVDEVWRYEEMWDRIAVLAERLGQSVPDAAPRAKAEHRRDRRPAREVLTTEQRARIARDAAIEFELLGYEP
jgi:hypothetical protein